MIIFQMSMLSIDTTKPNIQKIRKNCFAAVAVLRGGGMAGSPPLVLLYYNKNLIIYLCFTLFYDK